MDETTPRVRVALLALPESTASTLYGMYDVLASAGRDWALLTEGKLGRSLIECLIVSAQGCPYRGGNGLPVEPHCALADCPAPDVIAIPDLAIAPGEYLDDRHELERRWLLERYGAGTMLATACTAAHVLAAAGLLDGEDATTHWAYCDALAARYPRVRVRPNRSLVIGGREQRLVMAGGGTAWHDLALFLIARFIGTDEAMRVARMHLIDWHHVGQQPFASLTRSRQVDDAVIAECQAWIAQNYDHGSPVAAMARRSGLSERSFKRRFARATGMAPLEYVHTLRLEESKQILEATDLPVEAIAQAAGYEDASFFGRLFRRKVGLTPAQYRRRFRALRATLESHRKPENPVLQY